MEATSPCNNCNHPNSTTANYCTNCGAAFDFSGQRKDKRDSLVLLSLALLCGATVYWLFLDIVRSFVGYEIYDKLYYLNKLVDLIFIGVPIVLAIAIKNKPLRKAALVLAIVFVVIRLYWIIDRLIIDFTDDFNYFQF